MSALDFIKMLLNVPNSPVCYSCGYVDGARKIVISALAPKRDRYCSYHQWHWIINMWNGGWVEAPQLA
jgi:hypothetical protein